MVVLLLILCLGLIPRIEKFETLREYSDVVHKVQKQLDLQGQDVIQVQIKSKDKLSFHVVDRKNSKGYLLDFYKGQLTRHKPSVPNKTSKHMLFFSR